jgi:methylisocitrate lyase
MEDVLTDAAASPTRDLPLLVDIDTGWGGAFNIARTVRSFIKFGVAAVHIEDQVGAEALRPSSGQGSRPQEEMVDRVKAAVDARTDDQFVIMARTDAAAVEGLDAPIERAVACVEAGADMIFPEAMKTLDDYRRFKAAVKVPILANLTEFGSTPLFTSTNCAKRTSTWRCTRCRRVPRDEQGGENVYERDAPRRHAEGW